MKNFRKVIAMVLVLALTVAMSVAGTIAYLKDTDEAVNVLTMGNVQIFQNEQQHTIDDEVDNDKQFQDIRETGDNLEDFEQDKKLLPMVDNRTANDPVVEDDGFFNKKMKNVVDKIVTVTNIGTEDAYIRTIFAFEGGYEKIYAEGSDTEYVEQNIHDEYIGVLGDFEYVMDGDKKATVTVDGIDYTLAVCVYDGIFEKGQTTPESLKQIFLAPTAGNEAYELFGEKYDILVFSQGVQAAGFDNAEHALNAAFGEITATNNPWA